MKTLNLLQPNFDSWAEIAISKSPSKDIVAYSVNIYEGIDEFQVELIGSPSYDEHDQEWACTETFAFRDPLFCVPHSLTGKDWRKFLKLMIGVVRNYLINNSPGAQKLKSVKAVAVGFVDGDLIKVWPAAAA